MMAWIHRHYYILVLTIIWWLCSTLALPSWQKSSFKLWRSFELFPVYLLDNSCRLYQWILARFLWSQIVVPDRPNTTATQVLADRNLNMPSTPAQSSLGHGHLWGRARDACRISLESPLYLRILGLDAHSRQYVLRSCWQPTYEGFQQMWYWAL